MSSHRRKLVFLVVAALGVPLIGWFVLYQIGAVGPPETFKMSDRIATVKVVEGSTGELEVILSSGKSYEVRMDGEQFLEEVRRRQVDLPRLFQWADVTSKTSLLWVLFGFMAQGVFAGRMIVQWYASEKAKASIVPNVFWWMSLVGSSMVIVYFIWRKEIVGICGQATGWIVYVRNLWMIYGESETRDLHDSEN